MTTYTTSGTLVFSTAYQLENSNVYSGFTSNTSTSKSTTASAAITTSSFLFSPNLTDGSSYAAATGYGNNVAGSITFTGSYTDVNGTVHTGTFTLTGEIVGRTSTSGKTDSVYFYTTGNATANNGLGFAIQVPGYTSLSGSSSYQANSAGVSTALDTVQTTETAASSAITVNPDTAAVTAGATVTKTSANGVLSLDSDTTTGATMSVIDVGSGTSIPSGGVGTSIAGTYGHLTLQVDGSFSYIADNASALGGGVQGTDTFTYVVSDGVSGEKSTTLKLTVTGLCFLRGTRIMTATGKAAVEDLRPGDMLVTRFGPLRPLKWVGPQSFDGRFLGQSKAPVRFHAGSIADNVPNQDLYVSPSHSVLIGDRLVNADLLVNGVTVTQTATTEQVDYFHLDLGPHDCVIANGAWAESYAEQFNRSMFHNLAEFEAAFPDHAEAAFEPMCLPLVTGGHPALAEIRLQLAARVPNDRIVADGDIHLLVDGVRFEPEHLAASAWAFDVPANASEVRLMSRASSPLSLGMNEDDRMLGFCISEVVVSDGPRLRADDSGFISGVYPPEYDGSECWRWTDGDCRLPERLFVGNAPLRLTVMGRAMERYLLPVAATEQLAA